MLFASCNPHEGTGAKVPASETVGARKFCETTYFIISVHVTCQGKCRSPKANSTKIKFAPPSPKCSQLQVLGPLPMEAETTVLLCVMNQPHMLRGSFLYQQKLTPFFAKKGRFSPSELRFFKRSFVKSDIMSLLAKLFGSGKKGEAPPTPQEAIQRLREIEEMLNKKSDFLEKKVEQELSTAKKHGTKNKRGKKQDRQRFS